MAPSAALPASSGPALRAPGAQKRAPTHACTHARKSRGAHARIHARSREQGADQNLLVLHRQHLFPQFNLLVLGHAGLDRGGDSAGRQQAIGEGGCGGRCVDDGVWWWIGCGGLYLGRRRNASWCDVSRLERLSGAGKNALQFRQDFAAAF